MTAGSTWLYLKLIPGRPGLADCVLRDVVAPLVQAEGRSWSGWFFLRYADAEGDHVRVRIELPRAAADLAVRWRPELRAGLQRCQEHGVPAEPSDPAINPPESEVARPAEVTLAVYEPEYARWGTGGQLDLAHATFQRSSEIAIRLQRSVDTARLTRIALGAALLAGAGSLVADPARFHREHADYWSGRDRADQAARTAACLRTHDRIRGDVAQRLEQLVAADGVAAAVAEFTAAVAAALDRADGSRTREHLVFHHAHLMLNRIGVKPGEEAVAGILVANRFADHGGTGAIRGA